MNSLSNGLPLGANPEHIQSLATSNSLINTKPCFKTINKNMLICARVLQCSAFIMSRIVCHGHSHHKHSTVLQYHLLRFLGKLIKMWTVEKCSYLIIVGSWTDLWRQRNESASQSTVATITRWVKRKLGDPQQDCTRFLCSTKFVVHSQLVFFFDHTCTYTNQLIK